MTIHVIKSRHPPWMGECLLSANSYMLIDYFITLVVEMVPSV